MISSNNANKSLKIICLTWRNRTSYIVLCNQKHSDKNAFSRCYNHGIHIIDAPSNLEITILYWIRQCSRGWIKCGYYSGGYPAVPFEIDTKLKPHTAQLLYCHPYVHLVLFFKIMARSGWPILLISKASIIPASRVCSLPIILEGKQCVPILLSNE